MTDLNVQQMAEQPGQQQAQQPTAPGQSPSQTNVPGLPPTALSMQMQSMNDQYGQAQQAQQQQGGLQAMGAGLQTGGPLTVTGDGAGAGAAGADRGHGQMGLQDMAEQLARSYGLEFGRGSLVDNEGNFMMTPDQLAAGGGDMDLIAADMNRIAQAINDRQVADQQAKATAALQTGMGAVQRRGRGSLAAMQSNFFQAMAQNYTDPNLLPEQADFSYWIQKAGFDDAQKDRDSENAENGLNGGGGGSGAETVTQPTAGDPLGSTDTGPQGRGDVVTSGPNAGRRPVYTYDPINQTTTISWEDA